MVQSTSYRCKSKSKRSWEKCIDANENIEPKKKPKLERCCSIGGQDKDTNAKVACGYKY